MRIVILSKGPGNYSTKRLKKVAIERGHDVKVVDYARCYISVEQDKPKVRYEGENISGVDAIIPRISANYTKYGSSIVRQFEMMGVYTTTKSIALSRARDKLRSRYP